MLELKKGSRLADRYTLIRSLGGGGEARLWLAKDRLTATPVALKIVAADEQKAEHLRAEWQTGIRLMHAHIVRAFEFQVEADAAFYSQQFIDGPDISALAGRDPEQVLAPIGLIADALRYMHERGLVHRDIKASNVLLDPNGAPYLTDFGVSAPAGEFASGGSTITQSPQSLAGEPASPADDIFALGGLIYELLTGRSAYSSTDNAADIQHKIPDPLRAANGTDLPGDLVDLVADMLDKDAANRPDAAMVVERLKAAGFDPGVASVRTGDRVEVGDSRADAVESIRPVRREQASESIVTGGERPGISRLAAFGGLGVLLVLLTAVVLVLPNRVQNDADPASAGRAGGDGSVAEEFADDAVNIDPEVRERIIEEADLPVRGLEGEIIEFSENTTDFSGLDADGRARLIAETALGELLSAFEVLDSRGAIRWAPVEHRKASELYAKGDKAYLDKDFGVAEEYYLGAISQLEPLYERIEPTFQKAYEEAELAFANGDRMEALQKYELAVDISPNHPGALAGLSRARNLESVLRLMDQALEFEEDLDLAAAQRSFEQVIELDSLWEPAQAGLVRVALAKIKMEFDLRMTEGFDAIAANDFLAARAAFRIAQRLLPESSEPADGLLQIDQGLKLQEIGILEREALSLERDEHWDAVVKTYEEILKVDSTLSFARDGLARGREMSGLHGRLDRFIAEPDRLSRQSVMQDATKLVVDVTTRPDIGPRLAAQRDELSRLLKRAATALTVPLVSDNVTQVSIYRVGRLGNFMRREVSLRPGTYVAVGVRAGYRDVRQEFRVAPEIDIEAVIVRCEEPI